MTVVITLNNLGSDTGPFFDLYSNLDGYTVPFAVDVPKASLVAGYTSSVVPDYTETIRVKSRGNCVNHTDILLTTGSDLVITNVTSTDPTTLGGTDGTITVHFTGSLSPFTYSVNGVDKGAAVSPQLITGLSSNIPYTIVITDVSGFTAEAVATLGQSATVFDADWIMVTYEFTDGADLDTRTRIAVPNIGQDTQAEYLGWSYLKAFAPSVAYSNPNVDPTAHTICWGGDNTGTGYESVLVNIAKFKLDNPTATEFIVDLRAFWYNTVGVIPVVAAVTLWKGGLPIQNGCPRASVNYCWTNPTRIYEGTIDSVPKQITLNRTEGSGSGQRLATLKYNLTTFVAVLNNNDTTTPEV
jgi:hypothetical protein